MKFQCIDEVGHPLEKVFGLLRDEMPLLVPYLNDVEGIVTYALSVEGVLLAAFLREEESARYRISLRSKDHYDVGAVAETLGGGGHRNAAGLRLEGTFDEVSGRVVGELEKLLR